MQVLSNLAKTSAYHGWYIMQSRSCSPPHAQNTPLHDVPCREHSVFPNLPVK